MPIKKATAGGWEQVYWVRAADVAPKVKAAMKEAMKETSGESEWRNYKAWREVVEELGGDGVQADRGVTGWAGSSRTPDAMPLRGAIATMLVPETEREAALEEEIEDILKAETGLPKVVRERILQPQVEQTVRKLVTAGNSDEHRRTVQAIAAMSQSMHEEETLTLYRGIYGVQGAEINLLRAENPQGSFALEVGSLVSASESRNEALRAIKKFSRDKRGVILKLTVPRSAVVLSHRAIPHLSPRAVMIKKEVSFAVKGQLRVAKADVEVVEEARKH